MSTMHHVERIFGYRAFYLMHIEGNPDMQWTADDNDAFRYDDLAEAEQDAEIYGGEVTTFDVPEWRGHDSASRLAHQFELVRGATLLAAE